MTPQKPLNILHLTVGADAGGVTRYLVTLGTALHRLGHHIEMAGDDGAWRWAFTDAPFPYLQVPLKGGPVSQLRAARQILDHLDGQPVDLIHAHYRRAALLGRRLQKVLRRRTGYRPPLLYTLHLSHINIGGWRRWLTDFGDHIHVPSADAGAWVSQALDWPAERLSLIPHGIATDTWPLGTADDRVAARRHLGVPADALVLAYVGRLDTPKNEEWCLDVLEQTAADSPIRSVHLLYAGEGPHERALRGQIHQRGLESRVHLLGHVDPLAVYRATDLLLLPSEREGFSLVCAEAMSMGVPHVRTRTSGTAELTIEGVTGRSTPIDRSAFVNAAAEVARNPESLRGMGQAAAEHVRANLTLDRQIASTLALYHRLVAEARAGTTAPPRD